MQSWLKLAVITIALSGPLSQAGFLTGSSELMSNSDVEKIEDWSADFNYFDMNLVFQKGSGSRAYDFHSAVDGLGQTVTLWEIIKVNDLILNTPIIIGGYSPVDWAWCGRGKTCGYKKTPDTAVSERSAFLFNLNTNIKYSQKLDAAGQYQIYSNQGYGPTFGGGYDISTNTDLSGGYMYSYSYDGLGEHLLGGSSSIYRVTYGRIETFAVINYAQLVVVPMSSTLGFLMLGLFLTMAKRKKIIVLFLVKLKSHYIILQ